MSSAMKSFGWWREFDGQRLTDSDRTLASARCTICSVRLPEVGPDILDSAPNYDLEFNLCFDCYWLMVAAAKNPAVQRTFEAHRRAVGRRQLHRERLGREGDFNVPADPRFEDWLVEELRASKQTGRLTTWSDPLDEDGAA